MSSDNVFVLLEAKEHMISDDTKKAKFLLLLSCLMTVAFCIFHDNTISSLFGIIKIGNSDIKVSTILPVSIIVVMYHAFIYKVYYCESIHKWENKTKNKENNKENSQNKDSDYKLAVFGLNSAIDSFDRVCNKVTEFKFIPPSSTLEEEIKALEESFSKADKTIIELDNISSIEDIINMLDEVSNLHEELKGIPVTGNEVVLSNQYREYNRTLNDARNKLAYYKLKMESVIQTDTVCENYQQIKNLIGQMQSTYKTAEDQFIIEQTKREKILEKEINNINREISNTRDILQKKCVNEKLNTFVFKYIPIIVFLITAWFSCRVINNNFDYIVQTWKSLLGC